MTTNDPDEIRASIERTRANLSSDVDALTDKVSPGRVAERQVEKVKGAVGGVKDKVFGAADDAGDAVGSLAGATRSASADVREKAAGNPLAAGLVAFGLGLLGASLVPATRKEQRLARQAKESDVVERVKEEARSSGQDVAYRLREPAREAVEEVKATAGEGAGAVKETALSAADDVKREAGEKADDARAEASSAADRAKGQRPSEERTWSAGSSQGPSAGGGIP